MLETIQNHIAAETAAPLSESRSENVQSQMERMQQLLGQIEELAPDTRDLAHDCMQELLALYGEGLGRILEIVRKTASPEMMQELLDDKLIRGLLLIHNLHPHSIETRLRQALEKVRPYMESHGGNVELVSLNAGVATLRLQGTCKSCRSSAVTLELAVQNALEEACPDLVGFRVEGADKEAVGVTPKPKGEWIALENVRNLQDGQMVRMQTPGLPVVVCKINDKLYAYSNRCPTCNSPMHLGTLRDGFLTCADGHAYDLQHAGQSPGSADIQLEPLPLVTENNVVKVLMPRGERAPTHQTSDRYDRAIS